VSDNFPYYVCGELTWNVDEVFESLFIETSVPGKKLVIGEVCHAPSSSISDFLNKLSKIMDLVQNQPCDTVAIGNCNLNLLDNFSVLIDFIAVMLLYGILSVMFIATRVTGRTDTLIY
jgi:hypothetical protein